MKNEKNIVKLMDKEKKKGGGDKQTNKQTNNKCRFARLGVMML